MSTILSELFIVLILFFFNYYRNNRILFSIMTTYIYIILLFHSLKSKVLKFEEKAKFICRPNIVVDTGIRFRSGMLMKNYGPIALTLSFYSTFIWFKS